MLTLADLDLAWRRAKYDAGNRSFVTHPYLIDLIEHDRSSWLGLLLKQVETGYSPDPALPCLVPKPNAMLRPGCVLSVKDEVIYNTLVEWLAPAIWKGIASSQGDPDVAYQLQPPGKRSKIWVRRGPTVWREWRERSLARLTSDVSHVVTTDITGFYENVDIPRLISDLRSLGGAADKLSLLNECLHRWAGSRGKGIPQGYTASDVLAKVYLEPVDSALKSQGYSHLRYVDDIRIFCGSRHNAKMAVHSLTELISRRGLNLQTAKTFIKSKSDAHVEFVGFGQILDDATADLARDFKTGTGLSPYLSTLALFKALRRRTGPPPEILERKFREFFSVAGEGKFDKSLFHFLLGRLAAAGSRVPISYCIDALRERPDETSYILQYISEISLDVSELNKVLEYMESEEAMYDYQLFQLVRWYFQKKEVEKRVLKLCRKWAFDHNRDPWLREYCVAYLGMHGDLADLDHLEARYASLTSEIEKATYALSLKRLERGRRNAVYSKMKNDGSLVSQAISLAKQESAPTETAGATLH